MANITIDYNKLQDAITSIDNETKIIKDLLDKQNNNFKMLEDNKKWFGNSNQNCVSKYKELSSKYEEIITNLNNYKQFLVNLGETYKNFNIEAENKVASDGQ